jgi:hypothetical protein
MIKGAGETLLTDATKLVENAARLLNEEGNRRMNAAILRAAGSGYLRVHDLRFIVAPYLRSREPVTTGLSDRGFRTAIWQSFLELTRGWAFLSPEVAEDYHQQQRDFDRASRGLDDALAAAKDYDPTSAFMLDRTQEAANLMELSEALVNGDRFFLPVHQARQFGVFYSAISRGQGGPDEVLPMFQVARLLANAQRAGRPLTDKQKDLVFQAPKQPDRLRAIWKFGLSRVGPREARP